MAIKKIVKMGNKQLATPSLALENFEQYGHSYPGNQRVIVFGFEKNERYPDMEPIPLTVLINPVINVLSDKTNDAWEGCLSVPGLRGLVSRFNKIEYSGFNPDGNRISRIAEGFHARCVQHEYDHLDGILYPQRLKDLRYFGFEDALEL